MKCLKGLVVVLGFIIYGLGVMWFNHITFGNEPLWRSESSAAMAETEASSPRLHHTAEMPFYHLRRR